MVEMVIDDVFCKLEEILRADIFRVKLKFTLYDDNARDLPLGDLILFVNPDDIDDFKEKLDEYMEE